MTVNSATFVLDNSWTIEFPTPKGVLRLLPGKVAIEASFAVEERGDDGWWAVIACTLRIADEAGRVWEAVSRFLSDGLFYGIIDLSRSEPGRWLRNAPEAWRSAKPLLPPFPACYDDRFSRYAWLDNTGFIGEFKYFAVEFGLAALDTSTILVSLDKMFCSWEPVVAMGESGPLPGRPRRLTEEELERLDETGEAGDYDHMQAVAYPIEAGRILFRDTAERISEGDWTERSSPAPLLFRRTRRKGTPQACVAFRDGRLSAILSPDSDEGFTAMGEEYGARLEFATDEGGRLLVHRGLGRWRVKVEKHPDSVSEPFDVLRVRSRVADADGTLWEGVAHCTAEVFLEKLIDLDRIDRAELDAPAPGEGALTGIRCLIDDGAWRCGLVGDLIAFQGKGQRPLVDLTPTPKGFGVRISGLVGRRRGVSYESEVFDLVPEAWKRSGPLPAIGYHLPMAALAFRNTTFAVDDGFWHRNAIPIPVVFTRVGTAPPDTQVRFVEGFGE